MFEEKKLSAIILAAGKGRRMHSDTPKQYAMLAGKPLIAWSVLAFDNSPADEIVLVAVPGEEAYIKEEILSGLNLKKPLTVVPGGEERCDSVYEGLKALENAGSDIVLIHDGARPLVSEAVIKRVIRAAAACRASVAAVPVKDTIREADDEGIAVATPDRSHLWQIQTPQGFDYSLIKKAFDELMASPEKKKGITDDAMVVETVFGTPIQLVEGSYENIKVTTGEDLIMAEALMQKQMLP